MKDQGTLPIERESELQTVVRESVFDIVKRQVDAGIDIVNDGEMGKIGYSTYVKDRLTGFAGTAPSQISVADVFDFPQFAEQRAADLSVTFSMPACDGPISYNDVEAAKRDLDNLRDALANVGKTPADGFVTAASPGVISLFLPNTYYPTRQEYLAAIADAMRVEYELIAEAGFTLQLDCPDLAMGRHIQFSTENLEAFRQHMIENIEALNHAVANIPAEQMRIHLCWGNYEGPHHHDVPLAEIIDLVLTAKPAGLSFEAANPRHEHEWRVFAETAIPENKVLMPGVIDSCTNYIEHPELVSQRLQRFADIVGPGRVIGATDCGLSTFAGMARVAPDVAWAKLESLAEGARMANLVAV
jgi:5-methyltetrahydropteroyltriglutamate--homocysteine methyltransferase